MVEKVGGVLWVGRNEQHEVVINHPDLKPDENGVGHIVFSPAQARNLARLLEKNATEAEVTALALRVTKRLASRAASVLYTRHDLDRLTREDGDEISPEDFERDAVNIALGDEIGCMDEEEITPENIDLLYVAEELREFASKVRGVDHTGMAHTPGHIDCPGCQHNRGPVPVA